MFENEPENVRPEFGGFSPKTWDTKSAYFLRGGERGLMSKGTEGERERER